MHLCHPPQCQLSTWPHNQTDNQLEQRLFIRTEYLIRILDVSINYESNQSNSFFSLTSSLCCVVVINFYRCTAIVDTSTGAGKWRRCFAACCLSWHSTVSRSWWVTCHFPLPSSQDLNIFISVLCVCVYTLVHNCVQCFLFSFLYNSRHSIVENLILSFHTLSTLKIHLSLTFNVHASLMKI